MPKRRRSSDSDHTTEAPATFKTLFVNTNIDTHLALITSDSETLSDLKDEIVLEHIRLFPEMGKIKIRSLKVKRKGLFYHLPDYMLVKTAFEGVNKSWFLNVDVSKPNNVLQIVKDGATNQRDLLTTNSFLTTSASKDNNKSSKALHGNELQFYTGNSTYNKQNIKAEKLLGSHVEPESERDAQDTSSSIIKKSKKSKKNRKGSQCRREQPPASLSLEKCGEDNECINQNAEFEKRCTSTGKDNVTVLTTFGSHEGLEKPVESTVPSSLSDTKEVNAHVKRSKRAKSSKSNFLDDQMDQARNFTAVSHLVLPDTIGQELPESAKSDKKRSISGKHQVPALEYLGSSGIHHSQHDDMVEVNNINKTEEKMLSAIHDPQIGGNEELDPLDIKSTAPSALLVTKEAKTHEKSKKKRSKISSSGVQDERVDRSKGSTADLASKIQQNQESKAAENDSNMEQVPDNNLSSISECPDVLKAVKVNESTNGEAIGEKKQNAEKAVEGVQETVAMNQDADQINDIVSPSLDSPEPGDLACPSISDCPDVLEAVKVNESTNGEAISKKKQNAEKAVEGFQETVAMNRDADQINDIVSPSLDSPEPGDLACPSEKDQICQKIEERDLLLNNNLEEILSRDIPSDNNQNEPMIETVSNTNTCTATVAEEQKMDGLRKKKRARSTVSAVCQDAMDMENTETHTRPSLSEPNQHIDMQVEKDKDLLDVSKRIEASARKSSDASRGKDTPPVESPLNQVSAELESRKDGEVFECIGKETNAQQYFDSSHHHAEVCREPSVATKAKNNIEEDIVPSVVSAPKLQQDLPKSSQKDSIVSSAVQVNDLTESNTVKKPKRKIAKRAVLYAAASASSSFLNGSDATKTVPSIKENVKSLAAPGINSSSKTNGKHPLNRNTRDKNESSLRHHATSGKNPFSKLNGQVVKKSKQEKSFGTTSKAIFRDSSRESSLDENGSVDSSGSTRTPSDNSSSSSSSSSDLSEDSKRNGRDDKDKGGSKESILNSEISSQMEIPIGTILKSSSRFKKAKLKASQQLEDPDSQPLDFLPDT